MLYVVTAVHNRYEITKKFIGDLKNQTYKEWNLILVDDGSTDGTDKMAKELIPQAVIIYGDGNLFWGGALHKAYKYIERNVDIADDDIVLFSNDDTNHNEDFLQKGVELVKSNPDCQITACGFCKSAKRQVDGAILVDFKKNEGNILAGTAEGNCASTRALFMTIGVLRKIGGFHPILLPHYLSDYEFTIRGARKGYPVKAFEELCYEFDKNTTGDNGFEGMTLKKLFSKRCSSNPIYKLNYLIMTMPKRYLVCAIFGQMRRNIKHILFDIKREK